MRHVVTSDQVEAGEKQKGEESTPDEREEQTLVSENFSNFIINSKYKNTLQPSSLTETVIFHSKVGNY